MKFSAGKPPAGSNPSDFRIGGIRFQTGTVVIPVTASAANTFIAFPSQFGGQCRVFCTVIDTAAPTSPGSFRWGSTSGGTGGDGSAAGFWLQAIRSSGTANIRVNWIAIGPA